jgi:two-component system, LytTR family, sensor kinase
MKREKILQICFWIAWIGSNLFEVIADNPNFSDFYLSVLVNYTILISLVYVGGIYLCKKFLERKKLLLYLSSWVLLCAMYVFICFLKVKYMNIYLVKGFNFADFDTYSFLSGRIVACFQYSILAVAFWFNSSIIKKERQMREAESKQLELEIENKRHLEKSIELQKANLSLEREKHLAEQEKIEVENLFLRAQINPHFLHNTLNFFYYRMNKTDVQAANGIKALSNIMRHSLDKPDQYNDLLTPLNEEISHIESLILIYSLRHGSNLRVRFVKEGDLQSFTIIPHLLITLVENAFKHGQLNNEEFPLEIIVKATANMLRIKVSSKKRQDIKDPGNGIGLKYIANRLRQMYPQKHSYIVNEDSEFYSTTIDIAV